MRALVTTAIAAALTAVVLAPAASAQDPGSRQTATLQFTEREPGVASGLKLRIDYVNPDDPAAKPPAVRTVVETLARGARIDTSVPALCTASDVELMLLGAGACPAASVVGDGVITVDTGLPKPARILTADVTFLNNTNELIFVAAARPLGARLIVRAELGARTVTARATFLPGTLPDGAAIDTVRADLDRIAGDDGGYYTTPPRCRSRGFWRNRISFTYADGVTQLVDSRSPCDPGT